jgi:Zn-dependent peptidase ImmA (M78 family)/DNA-binding XRE family transcriptional regulator
MFDPRTLHPVNAQDVATLLTSAREARGHSVSDVSSYLRIPERTVIEIESGKVDEHLKEVYALICLYEVSTHSIFHGYFEPSSLENSDFSDNIADHVADCIRLHKQLHGKPLHLTAVPKARGKSQGRSTSLTPTNSSFKRRSKPTSLAVLEFRAQETIQKHNLFQLPINVFQIAENLGASVVFESFPSSLYMKLKAFCYREDGFSIIGINKQHKSQLQRYSMAHELHHFLYDLNDSKFTCGPANQNENIEIDAERFAAELLMPRKMIERLASNPLNLSYLSIGLVAQHFGVSYEAAAIRLEKFGLIGNAKEVCSASYRKRDRQKTDFLLQEKIKYLKAVFGLETGILKLREDRQKTNFHSLCGAPIVDNSHTVCWQCGLEINSPSPNEFHIKNPFRQKSSNLHPGKVVSLSQVKEDQSNQLSLNLDVK